MRIEVETAVGCSSLTAAFVASVSHTQKSKSATAIPRHLTLVTLVCQRKQRCIRQSGSVTPTSFMTWGAWR